MNAKDKKVLAYLIKNGCRQGDTASDLAIGSPFSASQLIATARKFDGKRIRTKSASYIIDYYPPETPCFKDHAPGIANPRTGLSERIPAQIGIRRFVKKAL